MFAAKSCATVSRAIARQRVGIKNARWMSSTYGQVPMGPPDPILGLNEAFQKDTDPRKISLGVGAYRDDAGKPWVLPSVLAAEQKIMDEKMNKEYAGIAGVPGFVKLSLEFAYGKDSTVLAEKRVAGVQTLSGTGACRIAAEFFSRFNLTPGVVFQPNPTWGNHVPIFKNTGLDVKQYRYYDPSLNGINLPQMLEDIGSAPNGSAFLLHACAHNPTGCDPTMDEWKQISDAMKAKNHLAFFDCAYQGFASGDAEKDAGAIRLFVEEGHLICLAQSFAKNFGLYGERVGAFSVVCKDPEEAARVESQLKILIRPMYSNPPVHGARIVETILNDPVLNKQWYAECKQMADRILSMRSELKSALHKAGSQKNWDHITDQIGMFCFSGISTEQVDIMREKHHIYMTKDGRISMAGVTSGNVQYIAEALHDVTK